LESQFFLLLCNRNTQKLRIRSLQDNSFLKKENTINNMFEKNMKL